jgi:hypothetical protein
MRKFDITKRENNIVELRDYNVESCIKKKESALVIHKNETMILTPEELVSLRISTSKELPSRTGGRNFRLYGYKWKFNSETV